MATDNVLLDRKIRLERRLIDRGISNFEIKYLTYLNFDESTFATAREVGIRMIILYSCAYVSYNLDETKRIADWLRKVEFWPHVSPVERELFEGKINDEEKVGEFSWRLESAYTLAWTLNLVNELHPPIFRVSKEETTDFQNKLPRLGAELGSYLDNLSLRDKGEIFEENIFNELATSYFRDLLFNGKSDTTDINRFVSFERHLVLNWLRRFNDITDWDDTDTST